MKIYLLLIGMLFAQMTKAEIDTTYELKKLTSEKIVNIPIFTTRDTGKIEEVKIIDTAFGKEKGKITLSDADIYNLNIFHLTSLMDHHLTIAGFFNLENWEVLATKEGQIIELKPVYTTNRSTPVMLIFYFFILLISFLAIMGSSSCFRRLGWILFTAIFTMITAFSSLAYMDHIFPFSFISYFSFPLEMLAMLGIMSVFTPIRFKSRNKSAIKTI